MTPSPEPVAWVLNLDAEDELALGRAHTPSAPSSRRVEALLPVLTGPGGLVRPGDQLAWPGGAKVDPALEGRAWCLTRWARRQLEKAGARVPRGPSDEVLRAVNHRRFSAALGGGLPGAAFVTTTAELERALARVDLLAECSAAQQWLLKRPLGYAGKGRRKLRAGGVTDADQAWLSASLREGAGLQVEPFVQRDADFGLHGWLHEDGRVVWGAPTVQTVDEAGAWVRSDAATDAQLGPAEREALREAGAQTAAALHKAAYFGPFGLDAFRWVTPSGARRFQPRCELNARFSMGWAVGLSGFGRR